MHLSSLWLKIAGHKLASLIVFLATASSALAGDPFKVILTVRDKVTHNKICFDCIIFEQQEDSKYSQVSNVQSAYGVYQFTFDGKPQDNKYSFVINGASYNEAENKFTITDEYVYEAVKLTIPENAESQYELTVNLDLPRKKNTHWTRLL